MHLRKLAEGWSAFTKQYKELASSRGLYLRNTAFYTVYDSISDFVLEVHGAELYAMSERIFRWLRDEAGALGDDENYELQDGNLNIALDSQEYVDEGYYDTAPSKSGGSALGWLIPVLLIGLARVCVSSQNDTPDYQYEIPSIDYNFDPSQYDYGLDSESHEELMRQLEEIRQLDHGGSYGLDELDGYELDGYELEALPSADEIRGGSYELPESAEPAESP
jgi:hypothetical protein